MDKGKRTNTQERSAIDYILIDDDSKDEIKELIVDEEGIFRAEGKKHSDHNTITATFDIKQIQTNKRLTVWKARKMG